MTSLRKHALRVLLAEDDEAHAELVTYAIQSANLSVQVTRVCDGEEAWTYLQEHVAADDPHQPELLLLDINMPKMGGLDLLKLVKEHEELRNIPAVILTTSSSKADRALAGKLYANSYLVKPMSFDALTEMIDDALKYWGNWNVPPKLVEF